jgi:DNA-directed RNA polymerase subunit M/transcription elongation factor TFIIS
MRIFKCPDCGAVIETRFLKKGEVAQCKNCGAKVPVPEGGVQDNPPDNEKEVNRTSSSSKTSTRGTSEQPVVATPIDRTSRVHYPALRTIALIYQVLAILVGILSVGVLLYGLSLVDNPNTNTMGISIIVASIGAGSIITLGLWVVAEIIRLFIRIEENTRETADLIQKQAVV